MVNNNYSMSNVYIIIQEKKTISHTGELKVSFVNNKTAWQVNGIIFMVKIYLYTPSSNLKQKTTE